ncbi:DUF4374 domain-containing protein [Spirosoma harenae]
MITEKKLLLAICCLFALLTSCAQGVDELTPEKGKYVVAMRMKSSNNVLTDYLIQTTSITSGTLSANRQGIDQKGARTYAQVGQTIFSVGSSTATQGIPIGIGYTLNASDSLTQKGSITFDKNFDIPTQLDANTLGAIQIPRTIPENNTAIFYTANAQSVSLTNKVARSLNPLFGKDIVWPSGMQLRDNRVYISYYLQNRFDYSTPFTDTAYVAVYTYPDFTLDKVIKDTRTGPAGSFNGNNGIFQTETWDLYTLASSGYTFSQRTKPSGFLRIKNGAQTFDPDYFFNTDLITGGLKIYYAQYVGNGQVLAEVGQFPQANGQWASDNVSLKVALFDLNAKTVRYVSGGIPNHAGQAGVPLAFLVDNGKAYLPVTADTDGTYIWEIDLVNATAKRGAKVDGNYIVGIFKLN